MGLINYPTHILITYSAVQYLLLAAYSLLWNRYVQNMPPIVEIILLLYRKTRIKYSFRYKSAVIGYLVFCILGFNVLFILVNIFILKVKYNGDI